MGRPKDEIELTEDVKERIFAKAGYCCQLLDVVDHDCDGDLTLHHKRHPARSSDDFEVVCHHLHAKGLHANSKRQRSY